MMVKVTRSFVAGVDTYPAGQSYDLPDEVVERVIKIGWAEAEKKEWPKHIGGGHYELSNGDKLKGKEAAIAAQAKIDASDG